MFATFWKNDGFLGKFSPRAKLNYPKPIVMATPSEKPSSTETGISVQYFSS